MRRAVFTLAIAWALLEPGAAFAFRCSRIASTLGPSLTWPVREVPWFLDERLTTDIGDRSAAEAAVVASFAAWTDVPCSDLVFAYQGLRPDLRAGASRDGPNQNVVVFVATGWRYDPGLIAVTTNAFDPKTGVVFDSDIELNDQAFNYQLADRGCDPEPRNMDLANTLTHEVGHVLGLDHPPPSDPFRETTMFASADPCETSKRDLEPDDMNGICTIYPAGQPTQQCFPPGGPTFEVVEQDDGFGGCTAARSGSLAPLAAIGVLIWIRRRR